MSTTALYQILVDIGAEKEAAREALEALARENRVATKTDIAELKMSMIEWMMTMAGLLFVALGFLIRFS